jgi:hypothetical protein
LLNAILSAMAAAEVVRLRGPLVVPAARLAARLVTIAGRPGAAAALRLAAGFGDDRRRSGVLPAAVRVERSRSRGRRGEVAEQTALTLWFGEGPSLPAPGLGNRGMVVAGTALALAGAAAVGAAGYFASQREAARITAAVETPEPARIEA